MALTFKEAIRHRRSTRTYEDRPVDERVLQDIKNYASTVENPYGIPIEFRFLDREKNHLSSGSFYGEPVITGAEIYIWPPS